MLKGIYLSVMAFSLAACAAQAEKGQTDSGPVPVVVGKVRKALEHETISVSGTVGTPYSPAEVSFQVSGKVIYVGPREGDYVKKGEVLARIDPTDFTLALKGASAEMGSAQAALEKAVNSARPELLEQARIAFLRAEDEHRRMKMLYDSKSLAPNDYEKYRAAYESARQQYEQAKAGGQKEDKSLAKASFRRASAAVEIAAKSLSDATLRAPLSGYVAKRLIEPGATAAAGHPVFEIVQMDPVEVSVGVPETDVHLVRIGQKAQVTVPAMPEKTFEGTVRVMNVSADPNTRTYMTRITLPNHDRTLRIGMVAEATVRGDRVVPMVTLPGDVVIRDPQGATQVFVYYPDQKRVYTKRVEIGTAHDKDLEIKSGLSGDELIVLAGQGRLRNGVTVSATEELAGRK